MKKVCFAVCLLIVMLAMIACTPDEGMPIDSSSPERASESIEAIEPTDISEGESKEDNDSNQDSENIMPLPKDTEELFGFNAETLLLGKTFKEIKKAYPDLVYTGNFIGGACFYSETRKIWIEFGYSDIQNPDNPNEEAIGLLINADAEIIFPDMGTQLSKSDVEAIIGTEVEVEDNDISASELEGEYIATFRYKGYHFLYLPEETEGEIFPDTGFRIRGDY